MKIDALRKFKEEIRSTELLLLVINVSLEAILFYNSFHSSYLMMYVK